MNDLLYKRKQNTKAKINWPDLVFYAEATEEPFEELTVTTLKSHYGSLCEEVAVGCVAFTGDEKSWYTKVQERAEWEMDNGNITVREHIRIDNNLNAYAVIDADAITDKEVERALTWLEQVDIPGKKEFGDPKSFTSKQVREIQIRCCNF